MVTAATVFRDYETDGVPASGKHKVKKSEARTWGTFIERKFDNGNVSVADYDADATGLLPTSAAFQAAYDATSLGDTIIIPDGMYLPPTIVGTENRNWVCYGKLTSGNFADHLPGTTTVYGYHTQSGVLTMVTRATSGSVPTSVGAGHVYIENDYYRTYYQGGAGADRFNGWSRTIDVQAGSSGIHQGHTKILNVVGQPAQTSGNGNYAADCALAVAYAPASIGVIPDSIFAGNDYVQTTVAATNWWNVCGREVDVNANATCTYRWAVAAASYGTAGGTSRDCAYHLDSWTATAPWGDGLVAGGAASSFAALAPAASLVKAQVPAGISYGMYLSGTPISQSYLIGNDIDLAPGDAKFTKSGQIVRIGSPGTANNSKIYFHSSAGALAFPDARIDSTGGTAGTAWLGTLSIKAGAIIPDTTLMRPANDNVMDMGTASFRIKQYFGVNTAISSSDARMKKLRGGFTDTELDAIGEIQLVIFQWLDSVEEKGNHARLHSGVIAQKVDEAFASRGLDARHYGLWCEDPVFEMVDEPYFEEIEVLEDYDVQEPHTDIVDGRAVRSMVAVPKQRPKTVDYPLYDDEGNRLMSEYKPEKVHYNEEGEEKGRTPEIPSVPMSHSVVVTETVERVRKVSAPKLDADGAQETRLGLRYEQLMVMRSAWLEREVARTAELLDALSDVVAAMSGV
jgi:hypothetical protein